MRRINGKVIGNPTVTPMAVPDWNQTDPKKADYIKNKPKNVESKANKMSTWHDDKVSPETYPSSLAMIEFVTKVVGDSIGTANTELESILSGGVD